MNESKEKCQTTGTDNEEIFTIPVDVEVIHDAVAERAEQEAYEKYNRYREVTCPACGKTRIKDTFVLEKMEKKTIRNGLFSRTIAYVEKCPSCDSTISFCSEEKKGFRFATHFWIITISLTIILCISYLICGAVTNYSGKQEKPAPASTTTIVTTTTPTTTSTVTTTTIVTEETTETTVAISEQEAFWAATELSEKETLICLVCFLAFMAVGMIIVSIIDKFLE